MRRTLCDGLGVNFLLPDKVERREEGRLTTKIITVCVIARINHCVFHRWKVDRVRDTNEHVLRNRCRRETVRSTVGKSTVVSYLSSLWQYFISIISNSYTCMISKWITLIYLSSIRHVWSVRTIGRVTRAIRSFLAFDSVICLVTDT